MPVYHTVSGRTIMIYLDVEADPDEPPDDDDDSDESTDDPPEDELEDEPEDTPDETTGDTTIDPMESPFAALLAQIAVEWKVIADDMNLQLVFVPGEHTVVPTEPPPGICFFDDASPADRILYLPSTPPTPPPNSDKWFKLKVGFGHHAKDWSRSTRTSYVTPDSGEGYIYVLDGKVPHISHELGHILGLSDRYFECMYWDTKRVIKRTCAQIRAGKWLDEDGVDQRDPVPDTNKHPINKFPHYAERVSLLMHQQAVPADTDYVPEHNLMSSSKAKLTPYQLEYIGIDPNGQNVTPEEEPTYRKTNWVAILGDNGKTTRLGEFHVWEDTTKDDRGLKYYPNNDPQKLPKSYPGWSRKGRALENGKVVRELLVTEVMGKKHAWLLAVKDFVTNQKVYDLTKNQFSNRNSRMCYAKKMILDLASN